MPVIGAQRRSRLTRDMGEDMQASMQCSGPKPAYPVPAAVIEPGRPAAQMGVTAPTAECSPGRQAFADLLPPVGEFAQREDGSALVAVFLAEVAHASHDGRFRIGGGHNHPRRWMIPTRTRTKRANRVAGFG